MLLVRCVSPPYRNYLYKRYEKEDIKIRVEYVRCTTIAINIFQKLLRSLRLQFSFVMFITPFRIIK
jgi:hypothetical protein